MGNVGKCKGIDSKLSNRKSDKDKRSTLQHKVTEQVPHGSKQLPIQIQVTQNCVPFKRYFAPPHRNMACHLVCSLHAELSIFI